jgi:hypothetical protein
MIVRVSAKGDLIETEKIFPKPENFTHGEVVSVFGVRSFHPTKVEGKLLTFVFPAHCVGNTSEPKSARTLIHQPQ